MAWTRLGFGKYRDKTLPEVLFRDPDWFFWANENRKFDQYQPDFLPEAETLHAKATSIRIPQPGPERMQIEYDFYYEDYTSIGFDLVPASCPPHQGSTPTLRSDHIDMSTPRQQKNYDKRGYRIFLSRLKFHLFGDETRRMTQKRCEEFFDDETRFHRNS